MDLKTQSFKEKRSKDKNNIWYNRNKSSFVEIFGVDSLLVISKMDNNNDDIPDQVPEHRVKIQKAGLTREFVPVNVLDPFFKKKYVTLSAKIIIQTAIPVEKRGLHISRISDIIAKISQKRFSSIEYFMKELSFKISRSQHGMETFVELIAPFSYFENVVSSGKKSKKSLENIKLVYSLYNENKNYIFNSGVQFNNLTACPCVQQTFKHSLREKDVKSESVTSLIPLLTHSQRCCTKVIIKNYLGTLDILRLLKVIDESTVRVQNTLPRDHELIMVYQAHKNPQFMEDLVRMISRNICKEFCSLYLNGAVLVETNSMESIHDFNIHAKTELSFNKKDENNL